MASFEKRVQDLPPELFNEIFDLTFTAPEGIVIAVDKTYQPPGLLHTSSATRSKYASTYYDHYTTFQFSTYTHFLKFGASLTSTHRSIIKRIQLRLILSQGEVDAELLRRFQDATDASRVEQLLSGSKMHLRDIIMFPASGKITPEVVDIIYDPPEKVAITDKMNSVRELSQIHATDTTDHLETPDETQENDRDESACVDRVDAAWQVRALNSHMDWVKEYVGNNDIALA